MPKPDISYVESASRAVAKVLKKGDVVILESTSPVGTTEKVAVWLAQERHDLTFPQTHGPTSDIRIAYCPERVLPGNVINELIQNDRVIGRMTESCSQAAVEVYSSFVKGNCVITNSRTAEMTKLTENASRDVGIAFANEEYSEAISVCDRMEDLEPALRIMTASLELSGNHKRSQHYAGILKENFPGKSAEEIVKLIPDKNTAVVDRLVKALSAAGL